MRRRIELILPVLVLLGFLASAVVVNLLLLSAEERGVNALEDSVAAEVGAIAGGQDQRFRNTSNSAKGFVNPAFDPYELVEGSPEDLARLEALFELVPASRTGFYLLDAHGTITQGVQLLAAEVGDRFEWPGYEELVESPTFAQGEIGVLPVSGGVTTEEPVFALVLPIIDGPSGTVRGGFVVESVVAADSDFNKEIGTLHRGDTGEYLFLDDRGTVIAANDPSLIGARLGEDRLLDAPAGVHRFDGRVVVIADVPAAGWRVALRQDIAEFEHPLVGPLDRAGQVLILVLLGGGAVLTGLLYRRLRAARAEQERLRRLSEAQQELVSIVSHELRTPVAGVLGFLETTLDHWDTMEDAERRNAVSRAAANAQRLQAMTRDVLDTQNVEAGRLVHVLAPLDLGALLASAVDAARTQSPERTFERDVPLGPVWVDADADRLHQVFANLLDNAQKSSPVVEPIEVELHTVAGTAEVTVRDHGAGITEAALERIFDKFVRERGDAVSGTGLGLYISRQVVEAHGGRIWAESEPGSGATFRVRLPLRSASLPSRLSGVAQQTDLC
jgi:signal transduction histidine kinase